MARRTRAQMTRDAEARPDIESSFQASLYFPRHRWPKGMTCRWIRVGVREVPDTENWAKSVRGGWQPVPIELAKEFAIPNMDGSPSVNTLARIGNHILCMKPTADVQRERAAQQGRTREQMQALDQYVSENTDAALPRFNRSSPTEIYGSGRPTTDQMVKD